MAKTILDDDLIEMVANYLRMGSYVETAALASGISRDSFYTWKQRGERERQRRKRYAATLEQRKEVDSTRKRQLKKSIVEKRREEDREHRRLQKREAVYVKFADAIERAIHEGELGHLSTIAKSGRGGHVVSRNTTTDSNGKTTTVEKLSAPDWRASAWVLERRHRQRFGQSQTVEMSGVDGDAIEVEVRMSYADQVKAAVADRERKLAERGESPGENDG